MLLLNFITLPQPAAEFLSSVTSPPFWIIIWQCRPPMMCVGDWKPVFICRVNRVYSFQDIFNRKFRKFGLKCLFGPLNLRFLLVLMPILYFFSSEPPKGTSLVENTCYELSCVVIGPVVWPGRRAKNTQTKNLRMVEPIVMTNWVFAPPTPLFRF